MNYTSEHLEQWSHVVDILRNAMPKPSFQTFIEPIELFAVSADEVTITFSNSTILPILLSRYSNLVESAVKSVFGQSYSLKIDNRTALESTCQGELSNVIQDFLGKQGVIYRKSIHNVYNYVVKLPVEYRIRNCGIILMREQSLEKEKLHIIIELPIHVKRGEADHIIKELTVINDDLEDNQCYDMDILEGTIRFRTIVDLPEDINAFEKIMTECMSTVEQDFISIMQFVLRELDAIEKAAT